MLLSLFLPPIFWKVLGQIIQDLVLIVVIKQSEWSAYMLSVCIFGRDCCFEHKISQSPCVYFHTNICYVGKLLLAYKHCFSIIFCTAELANCEKLNY